MKSDPARAQTQRESRRPASLSPRRLLWRRLGHVPLRVMRDGGQRGEAHHFVPLLRRLSSGEPLTVLAVGSSATGVSGGCTEAAPIVNASGSCVCPRCCGVRCGQWGDKGWARQVLENISRRWPARYRRHRLLNLGEPGGSLIPALRACPRTYLGGIGLPHLVLIDPLTTIDKPAVEAFLRYLLSWPSSGATLAQERPLPLLVGFLPFLRSGRCERGRDGIRRLSNDTLTIGELMNLTAADESSASSLIELAVRRLEGPLRNGYGLQLQFFRRALRDESIWRHYGLPSVQVFDALALPFELARTAADIADTSGGGEGGAKPRGEGLRVGLCAYSKDGLHPELPQAHRMVADLILARLSDGLERASALRTSSPSSPHAWLSHEGREGHEAQARLGLPSPPAPPRLLPLPPPSSRTLPTPLLLSRCEERSGLACYSFDKAAWEVATRWATLPHPTSSHERAMERARLDNISAKLGVPGVRGVCVQRPLSTYATRGIARRDGAPCTPRTSPPRLIAPFLTSATCQPLVSHVSGVRHSKAEPHPSRARFFWRASLLCCRWQTLPSSDRASYPLSCGVRAGRSLSSSPPLEPSTSQGWWQRRQAAHFVSASISALISASILASLTLHRRRAACLTLGRRRW
jgi:hypothetical protein